MLFVSEYHGGQYDHRTPPSTVSLLVGRHESWKKRSVLSERYFVSARWPISA